MSGSSDFGIGEAGATAGGAVIGTILGNAINTRRQHRLAREAVRYLSPGEKMAARIPLCYQGGRRVLLTGAAIFVLAIIAGMVCAATHNGGLTDAVFFGGTGAGLLLIWISVAIAKYYAIVLTDRRLLLFRAKGRIRPRLREMQIAVPRSQVSMNIGGRIDGAEVSLSFAPATGIPPVLLNGATAADARAIQEALATGVNGGSNVSTPPDAARTHHHERGAA